MVIRREKATIRRIPFVLSEFHIDRFCIFLILFREFNPDFLCEPYSSFY